MFTTITPCLPSHGLLLFAQLYLIDAEQLTFFGENEKAGPAEKEKGRGTNVTEHIILDQH